MRRVLVINEEPLVCDFVADCLQSWPDTEVDCALNGKVGARKLRERHFDLALIDCIVPEVSGIDLANIAVREDTPVVLLSGHAEVDRMLGRFGYPYLAKPFSPDSLLSEASRAMIAIRENIRQFKAAAARMQAELQALKAAAAESGYLQDLINGND